MAQSSPSSAFLPFNQDEVEHSITQRFEWIVDRHSDSLAVKDWRGELTYSALNQSANQLAHVLLDQRDGLEEHVGLLLGKDAVAIAAVIGVLKAGKAYVPLDPSYPFDRLKSISEHVQLTSILTDANNAQLADKLSSNLVDVIRVDDQSYTRKTANPGLQLTADTLAAIFYTSGSTGAPKGVMQSHRNVLHRAMIDTNRFHICSHDRLSLLTSPSYSVSLRNLFSALLNGAAICSFDIEKEGLNALAKWLSRGKITIYFSVPTVFRQLAGNLTQSDDLSQVRLVDLGGEPVKKCDVDIYKQYFPASCIFVNSLASNEAGLYRNYFVDKETPISVDVVPAGYKVRDKEVSLLDEHGYSVESGQVGEIVIRSRYLSPGYWRDPELTDKFFQPDAQDPLRRAYHTGDLGLCRPDGCLFFIGRKDFRTKIRGIRVELEEVESAIVRHSSVQEAVVIDRKDGESEDSRLIAYVVATPESNLDSTELRAFLKGGLPDYMLPSSYVFLEALPLTPNGKVDRKAILDNYPVAALKQPYLAPRNSVEAQLAAIWESIFKLQSIGIHDNFFELGGHSLLAVQLVARIENSFNRKLLPAILYQAPTIARLAELLSHKPNAVSSSLVPIQRHGSQIPFFWIHGDHSNAFLAQYLGSDQPLYGIEHQSQDGQPAQFDRVETIAAHYLKDIQSVQAQGPYFLGGYSFGAIVAFEIAKQLRQQPGEVGLLFLLDPPESTPLGTASRSPVAQNQSTKVHSHRSKVHEHLRQISGLGPKEKLAYILARANGGIQNVMSRCKSAIDKCVKKLLCTFYLALRFPLPASMRSFYILGVYGRALQQYTRKPYSGHAILVRTKSRSADYANNWSLLISGGVALYEVAGDHMIIRQEPYAHHWAETLRACLSRAQATPHRSSESISATPPNLFGSS